MATDYNILEDELKHQLLSLKRKLHMRGVHELARRHYGLSKIIRQRRRIKYLEEQVAELTPTVSMLYSTEFKIKDNEIKGYLVYLLKLKDYFTREVATKQEIIQQRASQIKTMLVKLCGLTNEYSKRQKRCLPKPMEYIKLENTSLKKNQNSTVRPEAFDNWTLLRTSEKNESIPVLGKFALQVENRISTLRNENRKMKDDIMDMRIFHRQYKKLEKEFVSKIRSMNGKSKALLEKSVATYEDKEEIVSKMKALQERCSQDMRKAEVKQHALNVCMEKAQKNEEFLKLQDRGREDARVTHMKEMMEKGLTGLEPKLENLRQLHGNITDAAGEETPEKMEETFKVLEDETYSKFTYLDQLLQQLNHHQDLIQNLSEKNTALLRDMSTSQRRLRWEMKEKQDEAGEKAEEANESEEARDEAREELDSRLKAVKSLYQKCYPDDASSSEEIDDRNAMEYLESIEKSILEQLMLIEYKRMRDASDEDILSGDSETDESNIMDEPEVTDSAEAIQPRLLKSETELPILSDLEKRTSVLSLDDLKQKAADVLSELESEQDMDEDEEDSATSEK